MEASNTSRNTTLFDSYVRQTIRYGVTILSLGVACLVCAIASDFLSYTFGYALAFQYIAASAVSSISLLIDD